MDEFFEAPAMEESAKKSGVKPPCALATAFVVASLNFGYQRGNTLSRSSLRTLFISVAERPQLASQTFLTNLGAGSAQVVQSRIHITSRS
jgi:hypothetical protein